MKIEGLDSSIESIAVCPTSVLAERTDPLPGHTRLLQEMIKNLIRDLQGQAVTTKTGIAKELERRILKRKALIFVNDISWEPFSFNWICEALSISTDDLRQAIKNKEYLLW